MYLMLLLMLRQPQRSTLAGTLVPYTPLSRSQGLAGWPDRPPAAPKGAYTDSVSPRFGRAALLAALIHREKTGLGQYIELSQIEATTMLLTPQQIGRAHV